MGIFFFQMYSEEGGVLVITLSFQCEDIVFADYSHFGLCAIVYQLFVAYIFTSIFAIIYHY